VLGTSLPSVEVREYFGKGLWCFLHSNHTSSAAFREKDVEFGAIGYGVFGRLSPGAAWRMLGSKPQKKPDGTWKYPNLEKVLQHVRLHCISAEAGHSNFHHSLAYLSAVFGQSEETWVCAPPVLVGAASGPWTLMLLICKLCLQRRAG
jgi:hypothetical protein